MHVSDPNQLEAVPVCPKNVVASQLEDSSLLDLGPSLQVSEPTALEEVANHIYDIVVSEEFCYSLAPQAPRFVDVHVQVPKDNGVSDALQGLPQVSHVLQH